MAKLTASKEQVDPKLKGAKRREALELLASKAEEESKQSFTLDPDYETNAEIKALNFLKEFETENNRRAKMLVRVKKELELHEDYK